MKKLLEIVSGNKELAAKIGGMAREDIIALARELGVELTEADFRRNMSCPMMNWTPWQAVEGASAPLAAAQNTPMAVSAALYHRRRWKLVSV